MSKMNGNRLKRSHFKTDQDYVNAMIQESTKYYRLACVHVDDAELRTFYLAKHDAISKRIQKYEDRKFLLKMNGHSSTSQANRLAVRAAERNLSGKDPSVKDLRKSAGMDKMNLITMTIVADVVKEHQKYPLSRSVIGTAWFDGYDGKGNEKTKDKFVVLKNDEDNVYWPIKPNARTSYTLPLYQAMSLLNL